MEVRLPDGRIIKNVPDGTTKAELAAKLGIDLDDQGSGEQQQNFAQYDPRFGMAETVAQMGSGFLATPFAGLTGIATGLMPGGKTASEGVESVMNMAYQPKSPAGKSVSGIVNKPFELLERGADWLGEVSGSPDDVLGATAVKTAILGAPALLGLRTLKPGVKTNRQIAAAKGQDLGYVVDPASTSQGVRVGILEGFGGKLKTQQQAALKNQITTDKLAAKAVGLDEGAPVTADALSARRSMLGQSHNALRKSGNVTTDVSYRRAMSEAAKEVKTVNKDFPELFSAQDSALVEAAQSFANKSVFDADSAVTAIRVIRERADTAYNAGDKTVGAAWKKIATAVEDVIERDLVRRGETTLVNNFRNARQEIAKTYSVQEALQGQNVSAAKLAAQLQKGRPLSGELRQIAEFAAEFPKITRVLKEAVPNFSPLDAGVGAASVGAALLTGSPAAALPFLMSAVRPLLRSTALGPIGQKLSQATGTQSAVVPGLLGTTLLQGSLLNPEITR